MQERMKELVIECTDEESFAKTELYDNIEAMEKLSQVTIRCYDLDGDGYDYTWDGVHFIVEHRKFLSAIQPHLMMWETLYANCLD